MQEYGCERYRHLLEDGKQGLTEYRKSYDEIRKNRNLL